MTHVTDADREAAREIAAKVRGMWTDRDAFAVAAELGIEHGKGLARPTWTGTPPTEPGPCWVRDGTNCTARLIEIERDADGLTFQENATTFDVSAYSKWHLACQWSPIPTPSEPRS